MASYGHTAQVDQVRSTIAEAKSLTVERLKKVLRGENLQVSGIKSELQIRLIAHIEKCAASGEYHRVGAIRTSIRGLTGSYPPTATAYPSPYSTTTPTASLSPQFASPSPRPPAPMPSYSLAPYQAKVTFKDSPFYKVLKVLTSQELKIREQTRDTARLTILLDATTVDQLQRDSNMRVMVFCAAESFESRQLPRDISFPQHGELKCNSDDVKANLKGLKNKPGTTRPADITSFIRKKTSFPNSVEFVYALTTKNSRPPQKYYLVVNLVQRKPVDALIAELRRGKFVSKDTVIREMRAKASDPDIVAMSSLMSLKDPVQMTRIQTPCRSMSCKHTECFDAAAYLGLQEQAPTWTCPCCNRPAPWDQLVFDQYFEDILKNVPTSADQVTVEPDGRWHLGSTQNSGKAFGRNRDTDDDDDDDDDDNDDDELIEIAAPQRNAAKEEFVRTPSSFSTPPLGTNSSTPAPTSSKRKHAETIDLTLDSDEEEPVRPGPKRSNTSSSSSFMNQYDPSRQIDAPYRFHMPPPSSSTTYNPSRFYTGP